VIPLLADGSGTAFAAVLAGLAAALLTPPHAARRSVSLLLGSPSVPADARPVDRGRERRRALVSAATMAGLGAWALVGGLEGAVLGGVAAGAVLVVVPRLEPRAVRQRRERMAADLPLAVDLLAACLAVGRPPDHALSAVCAALGGPLAAELGVMCVRLRLGADPVALWRDVAQQGSALAPLARTMARSLETGAPVVDGLRLLAADLRRDRCAAVEQRARGVAVRAAAPLGLCFLPAFVLVGIVPAVVEAFTALSWR
jgi:pilus assembly protein TadC